MYCQTIKSFGDKFMLSLVFNLIIIELFQYHENKFWEQKYYFDVYKILFE